MIFIRVLLLSSTYNSKQSTVFLFAVFESSALAWLFVYELCFCLHEKYLLWYEDWERESEIETDRECDMHK